MENYEKKYKEVLEKAKALYKASEPMSGCNVIIETLFPELAESEEEKIRKWIIDDITFNMNNEPLNDSEYRKKAEKAIVWLKKQTERKQLYIRFGKIPTDEKSKIYHGEIEVGTENGVSVYPAFETDEGDIVLGLSLPITKTTLYTQQHLIEYDNRPCYLVNGDYVGKDTDGQPLINNVSIIKKIDSYRVKEENQNEQEKDILEDAILDGNEDGLIAETIRYKHKKQSEQKPTDKVEPKFKIGDWIINPKTGNVLQIKNVLLCGNKGNYEFDYSSMPIESVDKHYHLWTLEDAKDGDVLACNEEILLFKSYSVQGRISLYCWYNGQTNNFHSKGVDDTLLTTRNKIYPATKEQRDLLFQKMKEAGYEWDVKNQVMTKIEQKPEENKGNIGGISANWSEDDETKRSALISLVKEIKNQPLKRPEDWDGYINWLQSLKDRVQLKQEWSEEDEQILQGIWDEILANKHDAKECEWKTYDKFLDWLKSLRPQNNITDEELAQAKKDAYNDALDKIEYHSGEPTFDDGWSAAIDYIQKKSLRPQNRWKPSDEQMEALKAMARYCDIATSFDAYKQRVVESLYSELKKLKEG